MRHITKNGTNNHVIITLHGTGGSATDLFQIAQYIDPQATLIGLQGEVYENGMARYFARHQDGSFDLRSLAEATYDFKETLDRIIKTQELKDKEITLMGYSNGANLVINALREFENLNMNTALLYHPSVGRKDVEFKKQDNLKVLLTSGANDPYITSEEFEDLATQLQNADIDVFKYSHEYGHQLIQEELEASKNCLK